jgi:hypothetical protein
MEKKECNYRNCNNDIIEMRKNAKFCCRNCKDMERTYIKRRKEWIEKYSKGDIDLVNNIKNLQKVIKTSLEI